jgi:hypothetical protein
MAMANTSQYGLCTKRSVIGHVLLCRGCCCGETNRGKPEVPVQWIKEQWKSRGLHKDIQLSISGCLGPCDLSNVVAVHSASDHFWLGNFHDFQQYSDLLEWAGQCRSGGKLLLLPAQFDQCRFDPFRASITGMKEST